MEPNQNFDFKVQPYGKFALVQQTRPWENFLLHVHDKFVLKALSDLPPTRHLFKNQNVPHSAEWSSIHPEWSKIQNVPTDGLWGVGWKLGGINENLK